MRRLSAISFPNPFQELEAFRPRKFCLIREAILGVEERRKSERGRHACQEPETPYLGITRASTAKKWLSLRGCNASEGVSMQSRGTNSMFGTVLAWC